jgi:NAD(P)H-hydrate repair Nnr-like enzyme with NAD(P)H-hydrate epimerase domain
MKILSAAEMQPVTAPTAERFGVASFDLMRNAASAVADFVRQQFPEARTSPSSVDEATTAATA